MAAYWRAQGAETFEIRQRADLERDMDLLALPGGESTVQGKLLKDLGMFMPLKERIDGGLPVFAVCAGLILLAEKIDDPGSRTDTRPEQWFGVLPVTVRRNAYGRTRPEQWFGVLPVTVRRNAYGRQLGSFRTIGTFDGKPNVPMTFIRAPAITEVAPHVKVLSTFDGAPTAVRWRNITAFTWHPELN